jgi:hypothetical protein
VCTYRTMGPIFIRRPAAREARAANGVPGMGTTAPAAALASARDLSAAAESPSATRARENDEQRRDGPIVGERGRIHPSPPPGKLGYRAGSRGSPA